MADTIGPMTKLLSMTEPVWANTIPKPIPTAMTTNEDLAVEIVEDPTLYPWTNDDNEKRRAFIFEYFNFNPDIAIKPQLEALERLEQWLIG